MANSNDTIESLLNAFIERNLSNKELNMKLGKVTSVNTSELTYEFEPSDGDPSFTVDMSAMPSAQSAFIMVPEVDSLAIVGYTNSTDGYSVIVEKTSEILFNGGSNGGLLNISDVVEKLNNLEDGYNDLVAKYNAHIHITTATVGPTAVPGVIAPTTSLETTILIPTIEVDIEDETVKH